MTSRRGTEHNSFGYRRGSAVHEGGSERWWSSEVLQMVVCWQGSGPMATPSIRSDGQCRGGCHCSRCLGAYQQEDKGKLTEEVQSQETDGNTLAENCFAAENSSADRRVIANLEKELQATLNFADGGGEHDNSIWIDQILLGRLI